jgi:hypothetical protein|nr:MAG TPA: hypothetical protein [Caudoviricetes sp.]
MTKCDENFTKPKRYIQFNDLVFLGRKSIDEQSESISLRENKTSRTFANGSYVGNVSRKSLIDSNTISLKIALRTSTWSEEHIQSHYDFIMEQLLTPGKLWAVNTGLQLVWCNAYVTSIQPSKEWVVTDEDYLVFRVEFDNPDGVWYKADEAKTFLEPFDNCDFLDMKASCVAKSRHCCNGLPNCNNICECCEDDCRDLDGLIDLCVAQTDLSFINDFFNECNSSWRVIYNCSKGKECKSLKDFYKHAICDTCVNDVMTGSFISDTVLDSHKWSFALEGDFKDPIVRINDIDFKIKGEYSGVLTANYKGEIRYAKSWECIEYSYKEVSLSVLNICAEMPYIKKGLNTVSVSGVTSESMCLFLDYESVTV